jgi:hypothetical protein
MTLHAPVHPQGSRIRVRRGRLPMNPSLLGRTGTVVELDEYQPGKYAVVMDGEDEVLELAQDELEPLGG